MAQETYQLKGNAAVVYEEQKVKAIFGPLASATLDAVSISESDTILDVACGTGIMARSVRERLGPSTRISGADLNEGMIDTAKALTSIDPGGFDWRIADAANMPFDDASFSVIFCQQGIQFFPDDAAAVTEMRRVLMPGGRLYLSVWAGANDFFLAMAKALSNHVSPKVGEQSLAPFAYDGSGRLPEILKKAGFVDVSIQTISVDRIIETPETSIPKEIMANPVGPAVKSAGDGVMKAVVAEIMAECGRFERGSTLVIPQKANLFCAHAG
jgi:SAM-dependent methyltransferase